MATTTTKLLLYPKLKPFPHPKPLFFSSNPNPEHPPPPPSDPHPTPTPTPNPTPTHKPFSFSSISNNPNNPSPKTSSFEEIRKNLAEFRLRATGSSSSLSSSPPSFQELYQKNMNNAQSQRPTPTSTTTGNGKFDFNTIRENLSKFKANNNNKQNVSSGNMFDPLSLSRYTDSFKLRPNMIDKDTVIGGSESLGNLPASIFGKEMMMRGKEGSSGGDKEGTKTEFVRNYSHGELGEKLRMLRPMMKKGEKGSFSLNELKDRLVKVRENEEKDSKSMIGGVFHDLKSSLEKLKHDDDEKSKKTMIQKLNVLGHLGGTPSFMLHPPKEHLVEKFFHPDNMSSAEKMKLELQKVRDEFKMSESDCGSARVQVAQLTTKIKHLSTLLHKKDKHSRKGLQEMVQKRKKLLKYLRRTDWDSYCLVLSKLGLRDNPDYKF